MTRNRRYIVCLLATALAGCGGAMPFDRLDRSDRSYLAAALQGALENNRTGVASNWSNPETGRRGTVFPVRTYKRFDGADCREFQQTATVDGDTDIAFGSACREIGGSWRIVDPPARYHPRYSSGHGGFDDGYGYPYYHGGYRRYNRY